MLHIVGEGDAGERLDRFLRARMPEHSRAAIADLLSAGAVRVNGRGADKGRALAAGDRVEVADTALDPNPTPDPELRLRVLYEDDWLVAVDKPGGVPSHPLRAGETGTVANALLARYPELRDVGYRKLEPGLLHRLDNGTSGVLLAARTPEAFAALREQHERGGFDKHYLALCAGYVRGPRIERAFLDASQRRVRVAPDALALSEAARPITTEVLLAVPRNAFSLVTVRVAFAARHQVRAHLAALGHPIAGDSLYGGPMLTGLARHFLHASYVALLHPKTQQRLEIRAPLAPDLEELLRVLDGS